MRPLLIVALSALVACSTPHTAEHRRAPGLPPEVTLYGNNLTLLAGDHDAVRVGFHAFDPSARVIVTTTPDTASMVVCVLPSFTARIPSVRECTTAGSGVREELTASSVAAIAIVLLSPSIVRANVVVAFDQSDRHVQLSLPLVTGGGTNISCVDDGCAPFFEMKPGHDGALRATASWTGAQATFDLLEGSVLGRSYTATGEPYREAAGPVSGASPLTLSGDLSANAEYALVLRGSNAQSSMRAVTIDATWP
jgi:hypothetical protein